MTAGEYDYDVVVIGSGFGGSVAALRLTEKGYRVLVLEAGARFEDHDFAETTWDLKRFVFAPAIGWFGIQRLHWLRHVVVLAGAGVGGGSLNYANTLYRPGAGYFADVTRVSGIDTDWQAELAAHYDQAARMLGVRPNPCDGPVEQVMADAADALGVRHTLAVTPVGVFFDRAGVEVDDPFFGGAGPRRTGCTECGQCMSGCRVGAKNTLMKNYLALAEGAGAEIRPLRTVVDIAPLEATGSEGFRVSHRRTGPVWRGVDRQQLTARFVVVAAGAWGTQRLLHTCRAAGSLPAISARLGELTRTNSEALLGAMSSSRTIDASRGVAITRSFHVDSDTHVENVRYGAGSNTMGLLATTLVDGGGRRWWRYLEQNLRQPGQFLRSLDKRRWSERTIIGLVMQSRDNSLTLTGRDWPGRRRLAGLVALRSSPGVGEPNPAWIPAGHRAIKAVAEAFSRATGDSVQAGGTLGDVLDVPMTAHFLGGCPMGQDASTAVIDGYHRLHGYPGISVLDGSAVSANLGVNPSLTITAQAERAVSLWPNNGDHDPRPATGSAYQPVQRVWPSSPVVPEGAPADLR